MIFVASSGIFRRGPWALQLWPVGLVPQLGMEPMPLALPSGFLTSGTPGRSLHVLFKAAGTVGERSELSYV